jgi:hypothetical protein
VILAVAAALRLGLLAPRAGKASDPRGADSVWWHGRLPPVGSKCFGLLAVKRAAINRLAKNGACAGTQERAQYRRLAGCETIAYQPTEGCADNKAGGPIGSPTIVTPIPAPINPSSYPDNRRPVPAPAVMVHMLGVTMCAPTMSGGPWRRVC